MIGHDNGSGSNKVQLSAGDLLGRTHEELVLLLIQLRRQSSALVKARDACLLEMESQVIFFLFFVSSCHHIHIHLSVYASRPSRSVLFSYT